MTERQHPLGAIGTIDGEAHPRDLTDEQLDDIAEQELAWIAASEDGLRLNVRFVLAMIREIGRRRANVERA